jgi:hypothetical protein
LTKASLASLPSHCMGLFLLAEGTHAAFDKVLARFFWEGVGEMRKYHWLWWEDCCVPQILGGPGPDQHQSYEPCPNVKMGVEDSIAC